VAHVVQHLSSKHEALSSNPVREREKERERERERDLISHFSCSSNVLLAMKMENDLHMLNHLCIPGMKPT
jgi:hypothetical protein